MTDSDNESIKTAKPRADDMELDCPLAGLVTSAIQVNSKPSGTAKEQISPKADMDTRQDILDTRDGIPYNSSAIMN